MVRGARQVGKSTLVHMLAKTSLFDHLLEIDFELEPDAASLFTSKDPHITVGLLEARYGVALRPGRTLLFLDEIQAAPQILASLRYFYERMPGLHVIAAGSLLDFALASRELSMPVGRIEYLHLGPMSFEEFLLALDKAHLRKFLQQFELNQPCPKAMHSELMRIVRQYLIVGGMPASVGAFVAGDHLEAEAERQSILSTYRDDFAKYASQVNQVRLEKLFVKVPRLVGSKFMYSRVDREERARDLGRALSLLCQARVVHRVHHTAANGIPLGSEVNDKVFKILFLDVGLMARASGLSMADLLSSDDVTLINSGAVCEQYVGQHLLYAGQAYEEPSAFCWIRQKRSASAELDYVIAVGETIIPVEVKAGKTGSLKSLQVFLAQKRYPLGLRFNSDFPSLVDAEAKVRALPNWPFRLLSLPFYLVGQTRRLVRLAAGR
ncbi:MAG: AAA family ATPase [Deltaproteobacteria bacterium]|nr:AAA family ATPase [Deltaproteobacteria bacterium]